MIFNLRLSIVIFCIFCGNVLAQNITVKEKLISEIHKSEMADPGLSISNDMHRIGFRIKKGDLQVAVIDGIEGSAYDTVRQPVFSRDSKQAAYLAKKTGKWFAVINGREKPIPFPSVTLMQFTDDNKNVFYLVSDGRKNYISINGENGKLYDNIDENSIRFNPLNGKVAYTAMIGKKSVIVYDKKESLLYDRVGFPVFSINGRLGYFAINNKQELAVIDGKPGKNYGHVESIIFSDNGKHYAYHAVSNKAHLVVLDGIESDKYDNVHSLLFNHGGSLLAYGVKSFVKDKQGFDEHLVINGKMGPAYETIVEGSLKFSNDGRHLACEAEMHDEFFVLMDGKQGKHYGDILQTTISFSPDNSRIAYGADNDTKRYMNVDGKDSEPYNDIYSVYFSPDNKNVVYSAGLNYKEFVVVNSVEGKPYESILGQGTIIFDDPKTFHYLALKDNKVFLVETTIQ